MVRKIVMVALALWLSGEVAKAANCTGFPLQYNLTNGTPADASQVMANLNQIINCINNLNSSPPQVSVLTSGNNATYMTPANARHLTIEMVGGGGGGGGSGTSPAAATAGGNTCWNVSGVACTLPLFAANGGGLGPSNGGPGLGGAAAGCNINITGGDGGPGAGTIPAPGGAGGVSFFGGSGPAGSDTAAGRAGQPYSGSGGGGAGDYSAVNGGSGGGAGGYCRQMIASPATSYVYTVGGGGSGGGAGTNGTAGGGGGSGLIIVTAY